MALNFPQADLPSRLRGGADAWDDGVAGLILSEDFFASAITGTVYDANCSEVTAVSESVGRSVSLTVLSPESATLADSTDRSAVFPAAGAEVAANSLDASTALMLSLLAEYATGNAIDLPISQYIVLNDTTEAGTNSDTQNGALLAQSAGSESSPADATHNTTLSTSGAGVEAGTATDTSATYQAAIMLALEAGAALDTPTQTAVFLSTESEVADNQVAVAGTYLTTSTGVATTAAQEIQNSSALWQTASTEVSSAGDSPFASFTLLASLVSAGSAIETSSAQNLGALLVMYESLAAATAATTQLSYFAPVVEDTFAIDIGGCSAFFVVSHTSQGELLDAADGSGAQFTDVGEVVSALEALVAELFGASNLTPELTRVLLEIAKTGVLMEANRIDILREELDTRCFKADPLDSDVI